MCVLYIMGYDEGFDRWLYHVVSTNPTVQLQTPSGEKLVYLFGSRYLQSLYLE